MSEEQPIKQLEKEKLLLEQKRLEKLVLGKEHGILETINKLVKEGPDLVKEEPEEILEKPKVARKIAAWKDDEDEETTIPSKLAKYSTENSTDSYYALLRRKFQQTMGNPSWASKSKTEKVIDSDDEEIAESMRCGKMLSNKSITLPKGILKIEKMTDLNKETRAEGTIINSIEFHPTSTAALVAGGAGVVSIFQVDGITNSKLQTIKFKNFHVSCARFSTNGEEFFIGAKNQHCFYYYDMMEGRSVQVPFHHAIGNVNMSNFEVSPDGKYIVICGRYGNIHLLSAKTKERIDDLKMNSEVMDVTFNSDGSRMYSYGKRGEIFEWDMNSRTCITKMYDEGCLQGVKIALSSNNQILATGSSSGIVNLYEMPIKSENMVPVKVISNLVTSITSLRFNNTSEILAIASHEKGAALRLVHFPSMTVFSNFPASQPIHSPNAINFSPSSGFFAVGNNRRSVLLYRLKHYKNY